MKMDLEEAWFYYGSSRYPISLDKEKFSGIGHEAITEEMLTEIFDTLARHSGCCSAKYFREGMKYNYAKGNYTQEYDWEGEKKVLTFPAHVYLSGNGYSLIWKERKNA